jgi:hypothetical protein
MAEPLEKILSEELAAGNAIAEVSEWPPKCQLLVILRYPFRRKYGTSEDVTFAKINDPHYWLAEYRYQGGLQTLACRPI